MSSRITPNDSLMRFGVTVNAVFSMAVGSLLLIGAGAVGDALGVEIDGWMRLFGVALIGHSLILAWVRQARNPVPWTWLNLSLIAPYPLLMIALATAVIEPMGGKVLVLVDGLLVGAAALVQYLGIRRNGQALIVTRSVA